VRIDPTAITCIIAHAFDLVRTCDTVIEPLWLARGLTVKDFTLGPGELTIYNSSPETNNHNKTKDSINDE
jgi:hypothetical protein